MTTSTPNPHGGQRSGGPIPKFHPLHAPLLFGGLPEKGTMYRLIVTGARNLADAEIVWTPLNWILHKYNLITVVHGKNPSGADLYAHEWCEMQDGDILDAKGRMVLEEQHPPDHSKGSYANNIRNQDMVTEGANACFGFPTPESTGTLDCMARAWVKGIDTYVFHHLEPGRFHKLTEDEGEHLARRMLKWGS